VSPRNAVVVLGLATLLGSPLEAGDEQQLKAPPPPVSLDLGKEASREPVLGATPREARTYPVVWIHVPGVRATLRLAVDADGTPMPARDRRALGVALGRVIAHEVVHVVAPGLSHGRGLMARALTRRELTAPRISFEPRVALVVRAAVRAAPLAPPAAPGILAVSGSVAPVRLFAPRLAAEDGLAADELRLEEGAPR
jgi:hypothetical protein